MSKISTDVQSEWFAISGGVVKATIAALALPLVLSACSNSNSPTSQPSQTPIAGLDYNLSSGDIGVPVKKPVVELISNASTTSNVSSTSIANQNYASLSVPQSTGNVISNQTKFSSKAYGVAGSPRVTTSTKVRKGGGRYQIGKPYTIRGVRYVPKEDPNYRATGLASWYGPNFHGRLTANGEVYDQFALSAAHPTMPLPSYAKVTNLENGASVTVRVNDRGPFSRGRIIDLSSRAAQLLGYTKKGVAKVKVEYVGRARMDGLDERQLLASYNSGRLNPNSIPANVRPVIVASANQKTVVKKQAPTVVALVSKPAATRRTLDAFDNSRFGADAPRPKSLVNGYLADQNANIAGTAISNQLALPVGGMQQLERLKIGPVASKARLFELSESLSNFGPVTIIDETDDHGYFLEVTVIEEDIPEIRLLVE